MIASACVIAQVELLKHAAAAFGWPVNSETLDDALAEARHLNNESAHYDPFVGSSTDADKY